MVSAVNLSGIDPTEFKVLVCPEPVSETITTKGGIQIYKPIDTQEKERHAAQKGRLVAVSPLAFGFERWPEGASPPRPGQSVAFAKYAGMRLTGQDGMEYILMNDKDIAATLRF